MRYRRVVCFLMGTWIGVSAMLALNVYRNFEAVETVLKSPPEQAGRLFKIIGPDTSRSLLRYTAGVENSTTFDVWEDIQITLGVVVVALMFLSSSMRMLSVVPLVMTLMVVFLHFKITPDLTWLGKSLEFQPVWDAPVTRAQFWTLHRIYSLLDFVKALLGTGMTVILVLQSSSSKVVRRRHHSEHQAVAALDR